MARHQPKPAEVVAGMIDSGPIQWFQIAYLFDLSDDPGRSLPIGGLDDCPSLSITDRFKHELGHLAVSKICKEVLAVEAPIDVRLTAAPRQLTDRLVEAIQFESSAFHLTGLKLEDDLKKGGADFCFPGQRHTAEVDSVISPFSYEGNLPSNFTIRNLSIVRGFMTAIQWDTPPQILENIKIGK